MNHLTLRIPVLIHLFSPPASPVAVEVAQELAIEAALEEEESNVNVNSSFKRLKMC